MLLSDVQIRDEIAAGNIEITPFDESMLQPASYDLKVGKDAATIPRNGEARMDLEKEGVMVIPAYAPAIIYSKEHLKLSTYLAGRFGLKSSLSRRGIYASVGPQVDPGFIGRLSVTLFNLTPLPVPLSYGDSFLSLELHRLDIPASRPYSGEFQGKDTFTSKDIEPVLGYKSGLSEVVKGFSEVHEAIEKLAIFPKKFDDFLHSYEKFLETSAKQNERVIEFNQKLIAEMKALVEYIAGERTETVVLRTIPREQAKKEILDLFKTAKGSLFYSDVARRLGLDLKLVVELCNELEDEGRIGALTDHEAEGTEKKSE